MRKSLQTKILHFIIFSVYISLFNILLWVFFWIESDYFVVLEYWWKKQPGCQHSITSSTMKNHVEELCYSSGWIICLNKTRRLNVGHATLRNRKLNEARYFWDGLGSHKVYAKVVKLSCTAERSFALCWLPECTDVNNTPWTKKWSMHLSPPKKIKRESELLFASLCSIWTGIELNLTE